MLPGPARQFLFVRIFLRRPVVTRLEKPEWCEDAEADDDLAAVIINVHQRLEHCPLCHPPSDAETDPAAKLRPGSVRAVFVKNVLVFRGKLTFLFGSVFMMLNTRPDQEIVSHIKGIEEQQTGLVGVIVGPYPRLAVLTIVVVVLNRKPLSTDKKMCRTPTDSQPPPSRQLCRQVR